MKNTLNIVLLITLVAAAGFAVASAGEVRSQNLYVIGVPQYLLKEEREAVLRHILEFVLEKVDSGEVVVVNGLELQPIATLAIPEGSRGKNPRARAQMLKVPLAAVVRFFGNDTAYPPEQRGVVLVPQLLELAATQIRKPGQPMTVIVFGSPYYADPKEPAFRFDEGFVPSDGHLMVDRTRSIFGTVGREDMLNGVTVHYCFLHECFTNDYTRNAITRFWSLYVKQQGGTLASFAAAPQVVMDRVARGMQEPVTQVALNTDDNVILMRKVIFPPGPTVTNRVAIPNVVAPRTNATALRPAVPTAPSPMPVIAPQPAPATRTSAAVPEPPVTPKNKFGIAVRANPATASTSLKEPDIDVDLYVQPPGCPELSFKRTACRDGIYFRDVRCAIGAEKDPRWKEAWEYVELDGDVDVRHTSAWLNLYSGSGVEVTGVVRVAMGNRVVSIPFRMRAVNGNQGADADSRAASPYWTRIDLAALVDH